MAPSESARPTIPATQHLTRDQLYQVLADQAFFVTTEGQHYTATVWVSEFGIGAHETGTAARTWFGNVTDYFADHDADFAYWPLVGREGHDDWALLRYDSAGRRSGILDQGDWRGTAWDHLMMSPTRTGYIASAPVRRMLTTDRGDQVQSLRVRARGDGGQPEQSVRLTLPPLNTVFGVRGSAAELDHRARASPAPSGLRAGPHGRAAGPGRTAPRHLRREWLHRHIVTSVTSDCRVNAVR